MTCQNYLKIPVYSDIRVLKEKLFFAMYEGGNTLIYVKKIDLIYVN